MEVTKLWGNKEFNILVSLDSPKGTDVTAFARNAQMCKGRVEAILVHDSQDGIMRMSPLGACWNLLHLGIRPVLCMNVRDRNRLAIQGDLLSAWSMGVRDVLVQDGKDPSFGDHPLTRPVRDMTESDLISLVAGLNNEKDMAGIGLRGGTGFNFGALTDWLDDDEQIDNAFSKMKQWSVAGAEVFVTSPQFDMTRAKTLAARAKELGKAIYVQIMLLKSVGMARYLNEVPGISRVPEQVIEKMASAPVKAKAGIEIAAEAINELRGVVDGVVVVPLGWERKLPDVLEAIGR